MGSGCLTGAVGPTGGGWIWLTGAVPWEPLGSADDGPVEVASGLNRVLRSLGAPSADAVGSLFEDWPALVGEQVAAHVRPLRLSDRTLVLGVNEPGWATQVRWMATELLSRLEEGLGPGVVTAIDVRMETPQTSRRPGDERP